MMRRLVKFGTALLLAAGLLAAPAAHAFLEQDAGIFTVVDKEGKLTALAYRFYTSNGKWVAEERAPDGSWVAFKCQANCEIVPLPEAELKRLLGKVADDLKPTCIGNSQFAVCRYILKAAALPLRFMLMVQTPQGISLIHLVRTASI